jgi:hypothetical protein
MMVEIQPALQICGLSRQEAADFFGISMRTLERWLAGGAPDGAMAELADFYDRMDASAEAALAVMRANPADSVDLHIAEEWAEGPANAIRAMIDLRWRVEAD